MAEAEARGASQEELAALRQRLGDRRKNAQDCYQDTRQKGEARKPGTGDVVDRYHGLLQKAFGNDLSPEAKKAKRRNAVREVVATVADAKEQERLYAEKTGASRADFFRRKREVESGEFEEADAA